MRISPAFRVFVLGFMAVAATSCADIKDALRGGPDTSPPDSLPVLLNDSLPFQYPVGLYMQLIDDSVTLRLHIDSYGRPVPESTKVEVAAKYPDFDSSAVRGATSLVFRPAYRDGVAVAYTVLFPIQFKIPTRPVERDSSSAPNDSSAR